MKVLYQVENVQEEAKELREFAMEEQRKGSLLRYSFANFHSTTKKVETIQLFQHLKNYSIPNYQVPTIK